MSPFASPCSSSFGGDLLPLPPIPKPKPNPARTPPTPEAIFSTTPALETFVLLPSLIVLGLSTCPDDSTSFELVCDRGTLAAFMLAAPLLDVLVPREGERDESAWELGAVKRDGMGERPKGERRVGEDDGVVSLGDHGERRPVDSSPRGGVVAVKGGGRAKMTGGSRVVRMGSVEGGV